MDTKKHLMNLSRLRQLGPQQFTKTAKAEKGQAFFNYLSVFFFLEKNKNIWHRWENKWQNIHNYNLFNLLLKKKSWIKLDFSNKLILNFFKFNLYTSRNRKWDLESSKIPSSLKTCSLDGLTGL